MSNRHREQKVWPQAVINGSLKSSRQIEHFRSAGGGSANTITSSSAADAPLMVLLAIRAL